MARPLRARAGALLAGPAQGNAMSPRDSSDKPSHDAAGAPERGQPGTPAAPAEPAHRPAPVDLSEESIAGEEDPGAALDDDMGGAASPPPPKEKKP